MSETVTPKSAALEDETQQVLEPSPEAYNTFIAGLTLAAVDIVKITAERRRSGHAPATKYALAAGWHAENAMILWRYDITAQLTDEEHTDFGTVETSVVIAAQCTGDVDPACAERFGGTSGAFIAHPYLREAIASTAQRLGFGGVLLPMLKDATAAAEGEQ